MKCNNFIFYFLDGLIYFFLKKIYLKYCDIVKVICKYNKKYYCICCEKKNFCWFFLNRYKFKLYLLLKWNMCNVWSYYLYLVYEDEFIL